MTRMHTTMSPKTYPKKKPRPNTPYIVMGDPQFVPEYSKPDAPGIAMNFDNTVSIYHIVQPDDTFEEAVGTAFHLLRKAQQDYPDWPRVFYVDILGHEGERSGFDDDLYEFQQEFWFSTIAHFVTAFDVPMLGGLVNPQPQRNDIPDELVLIPRQ